MGVSTDGSKPMSISKEEVISFLKWSGIFFAPAALVFLTQLQAGVELRVALGSLYTWGLMRAIQFLSKFTQDTK